MVDGQGVDQFLLGSALTLGQLQEQFLPRVKAPRPQVLRRHRPVLPRDAEHGVHQGALLLCDVTLPGPPAGPADPPRLRPGRTVPVPGIKAIMALTYRSAGKLPAGSGPPRPPDRRCDRALRSDQRGEVTARTALRWQIF
jgi:hypothetical protein